MRKVIAWIIALIIIALIILYAYWLTVPGKLSKALSEETKVTVTVAGLHMNLNTLIVNEVKIGNTPGSILPTALEINKITSQTPVIRYVYQNPLVIEELTLDDIYVGLEFDSPKGSDGNWTRIVSNMQKSREAHKAADPKNQKERVVKINKVVLKDIRIEMVFRTGDQRVRRLPPIKQIEFYDLSTEGDSISRALMDSIIVQMLEQIFLKENIKNMLKSVINLPAGTVNKVLSPFEGIFP